MNYFGKIFTAAAALVLCCTNIFAQEQNPADTAASAKPAFPEDAPILRQDGAQKLYYIRDVNIHGVQYLNPDHSQVFGRADAPATSIYLPSNFIANAISRLWSQRFFSDVKIGAEIEGDSLDLEVFLKERPRVNNWDFEGISKGKKKDLLEKLKLKRGSELSDYVIDKNQKLIKAYWSEKGFRNTEVSTRITNDTLRPQMVNVTFLIDRKHKVKIRQDQLHGQRAVQGQAPAPDLQEDAPEEHQLLPRHQTQRERLRERQGPADRLLQLERLPQRHDRQRLDLSDQRQAAGHRPRHFGRQQILHPQRVVGRQLGVRNRRPAAHVRRQQGRHVRQEVDAQASGHRQGDRSRSNVRIVALPEQGLPDVADRTRRNHHRRPTRSTSRSRYSKASSSPSTKSASRATSAWTTR